MLSGRNKELRRIIKLKNEGKVTVAKNKLAEFKKKKHTTEINIRSRLIETYFEFIDKKHWEKGFKILDEILVECESLNIPLLVIDVFYVKAYALYLSEQYKKSLEIIKIIKELLDENSNIEDVEYKKRKAHLFLLEGFNYNWMGQNKHARDAAAKGLDPAKELDDSEVLLDLYELLGNNDFQLAEVEDALAHYHAGYQLAQDVGNNLKTQQYSLRLMEGYQAIGNIELAMKYCDLTIEWWKKHKQDYNYVLLFKANIYWESGELTKAIEIGKRVLPTFEKLTDLWGRALCLDLKAAIEWFEGSLDKAIEYMHKAIDLVKKRDDIFRSMVLSVRLVPMLFDKGRFDQVLEIGFSCLEAFKENKNPYYQASIFETMGSTYHVKGDYNLALDYCQKSLKLWKKFKAPLRIIHSLFILVQIAIDKKDKELCSTYLKELEEFAKQHPTDYMQQIFRTTQALDLKASPRPRNWMRAADILEQVVEEKIIKHGVSVIALINLCEILMNEFSLSGDIQVLEELEHYAEKLTELALMENIHHLKIEASNIQLMILWLKAQHSLVELDIQKARNLLQESRKIADEKGLFRLAEKLTQQQELLMEQLSQWDGFIRKYYEFIKE
jgi:tetratricopeptide (TPR) repeat protein